MKAGNCTRVWRPLTGVMLAGALAFAVSAQGGPRVTDGSSRTRTKSETARQVTGPVETVQSIVAGTATSCTTDADCPSGSRCYEAIADFCDVGDMGCTCRSAIVRFTPMKNHPAGTYNTAGYTQANITGNKLTVPAGGFISYWNVFFENWNADGDAYPTLRNYEFRPSPMGWYSGLGTPLDNAVVACATPPDCDTAFGERGSGCSSLVCNYAWVNKFVAPPVNNPGRSDNFGPGDPFSCQAPTYDVGQGSPNAPAGTEVGPNFFGSNDPDQAGSPPILCGMIDPGTPVYAGSMALQVPAGAKGLYTLPFDTSLVVFTDPSPDAIPVAELQSGELEITVGRCCYGFSPPPPECAANVTQAECATLAAGGSFAFDGGNTDDCPADGGPECPACRENIECNDFDNCTIDTCVKPPGEEFGACSSVDDPAWSQATQCCDPGATGAARFATIEDPNTCTNASCSGPGNRGTLVITPVPAGDPCKGEGDGNPCTFDDSCDGTADDNCAGTPVNDAAIPCLDDAECQAATGLSAPTCVSGTCNCTLVPDLTIEVTPGDKADPNCFASGTNGEKVIATVHVAAATAPINGGQFLITYDTSCLSFVSVEGVDPYVDQVYGPIHDAAAGTIFTVVGVGFGVGNGPAGNADLVELSFTKIGDCNSCQICFAGNNPQNTYLVDNTGQRVGVNPLCSKAIIANNVITLHVPEDDKVNVDCDQPTATESWSAPSVEDSCGNSTLVCTGEHQSGAVMDDKANGGGTLPVGFTNFCCTATSDWCDKEAEDCWTIEVNDQVGLDIEIALSPTSQSKPADDLVRCIKFTLYPNTLQEPFRFEQDISFGGLDAFVGKSKDAIKIPTIGQWDCISAWDKLHTLRSCYLFGADDCVGGRLQATFKGDPAFGGNWLIGGNLDGWKKEKSGGTGEPSEFVIDILDYGTFASQWGVNYGSGDTPCGTPGPNADINGDGLVTMEDYAFISMNFLASAKECCDYCAVRDPVTGVCKEGLPAGTLVQGLTEVSVRELREAGLGDLAAGDVNGDGLLNVEDMNSFMQGARPEGKGVRGIRKGSSGSR